MAKSRAMVVSSLIFIFLSSTRFILNSPSFELVGVGAAGAAGTDGATGAGLTGAGLTVTVLDVFFEVIFRMVVSCLKKR
jgi:hypothetical protein